MLSFVNLFNLFKKHLGKISVDLQKGSSIKHLSYYKCFVEMGLPIDKRINYDYFCMQFGTHTLYHVKNTS